MPFEVIDRVRNEFGDQFNWHVKLVCRPPSLFNSRTEKAIWQDKGSSLSVSLASDALSQFFRLRCGDEISVDLLPKHCLRVTAANDLSHQTIDHFLADQVVPRAMSHEGLLVVHAGGVQIRGSAVLFVGSSGMGKSTLTASFNNAGFALMGDDAIVLSSDRGEVRAQPVYPSLRLLPDSINALLPSSVATIPVSRSSMKQRINTLGSGDKVGPKPISAIFKLEEPSSAGGIHLRRLSIADTCMSLIENSFSLDPTDMKRVSGKLSVASEFGRRIPAFALSYPRDYGCLTDVQNFIVDHLS